MYSSKKAMSTVARYVTDRGDYDTNSDIRSLTFRDAPNMAAAITLFNEKVYLHITKGQKRISLVGPEIRALFCENSVKTILDDLENAEEGIRKVTGRNPSYDSTSQETSTVIISSSSDKKKPVPIGKKLRKMIKKRQRVMDDEEDSQTIMCDSTTDDELPLDLAHKSAKDGKTSCEAAEKNPE